MKPSHLRLTLAFSFSCEVTIIQQTRRRMMADPEDIVNVSDREEMSKWMKVMTPTMYGRVCAWMMARGGMCTMWTRRRPKQTAAERVSASTLRMAISVTIFARDAFDVVKSKEPAVFMTHTSSSVGYSLNYCESCRGHDRRHYAHPWKWGQHLADECGHPEKCLD